MCLIFFGFRCKFLFTTKLHLTMFFGIVGYTSADTLTNEIESDRTLVSLLLKPVPVFVFMVWLSINVKHDLIFFGFLFWLL
ncbi:hypothetical protein Hanom_Chr12g01103171 [Helianthus anomalus]